MPELVSETEINKDLLEWMLDPTQSKDGPDGVDLDFWRDSINPLPTVAYVGQRWHQLMSRLDENGHNDVLWRIIGEPLWTGEALEQSMPISEGHMTVLRALETITESIPLLHRQNEPMGNGYFMLWDVISKSLHSDTLKDEALDILTELSEHQDRRVQCAALHGLGHLDHPGKSAVVQRFIDKDVEAKQDLEYRKWLEGCRDGTVM